MSHVRQAFVRTVCSPRFEISNVTQEEIVSALQNFVIAAQTLDVIKRAIFYGKLPDGPLPRNGRADSLNFELIHQDAFHGIIGKATEAGELVERLLLMARPDADAAACRTNLIEELGDDDWYSQLLYSFLGITQLDAQEINTAKLLRRFPNAFSTVRALKRDLAAEGEAMRPA